MGIHQVGKWKGLNRDTKEERHGGLKDMSLEHARASGTWNSQGQQAAKALRGHLRAAHALLTLLFIVKRPSPELS